MTATIHLVGFSAPGGDPVPPGILAYGPHAICVRMLEDIDRTSFEVIQRAILDEYAAVLLQVETGSSPALAVRSRYRGGRKSRSAQRRLARRERRIGGDLRAIIAAFARDVVTTESDIRLLVGGFLPYRATDERLLERWGAQ